MTERWIETTIGEQATLQRGIDITKAQQQPGSIPVISSGGISSHHDTSAVSGPGVLLGRKGVVGSVYYIDSDYWPHDTTLWVKNFHGNHPRFVYYFFKSIAPQIARMDVGSANPTLNRNHVHPIAVRWPPISQQKAIAHILGTLDDEIELNRRMNETLEAMARAIFKSWFVDFDPVRAKADGRKTGLPKPIADLFPDSFDDSELGKIPKGWRVKRLEDICGIGRGSSPRPIHDFMGGTIPWIKIADATAAGGPFIYETNEHVTEAGAARSVWVNPGDLILSNSATCGVPIYVGLRGCIHDGWLHFSGLHSVSRGFLFHWLGTISEHLIHIADGSVQKNLNTALVGRQLLTIPTAHVVKEFDRFNDIAYQRVEKNIQESRTLSALRDALLPKLLSGEIRVGDAERIAGRYAR